MRKEVDLKKIVSNLSKLGVNSHCNKVSTRTFKSANTTNADTASSSLTRLK